MAEGDAAAASGMAVVPDTGPDTAAKIRWGAREINRTRDYIAQVKSMIMSVWSVDKGGTGASTKAEARQNLGIRSGTSVPTGGDDGDIYFKVIL